VRFMRAGIEWRERKMSLTDKEYVVMQILFVVFCVGVVWFYTRFLYALLRERPRHRVTLIRHRNESQVEKKANTGLGRVA
jgi:hypothetical protein